jgi:hypothetical protein
MAHITFIHGMANKPEKDRLHTIWKEALERDNPKPEVFPSPNYGINFDTENISSQMVYWADVLYAAPDDDESGYGYESGPEEKRFEGVSREIQQARKDAIPFDLSSLSPEEQEAFKRISQQLGVDQVFTDDHLAAPEDLAKATRGDYRLERIPLPWFIKKQVMKVLLRDVHHYLFNAESNPSGDHAYAVKDELRSRLLDALNRGAQEEGPHIVVSHSMGTIIAYDVLRNCSECPAIDHLVTLGSPLGLDEVQDKLKAPGLGDVDFPSEKLKGEWVNIFDHLDPVAGFDPHFANDYLKSGVEVVKDINEQNWGDWRHSIQKYLSGTQLRAEVRRLLGFGI